LENQETKILGEEREESGMNGESEKNVETDDQINPLTPNGHLVAVLHR
jgi:hypothetical protein